VYYPAANQVALATNGTQAVLVNATQGVQFNYGISVGGTAPSTDGTGIKFPATQISASDANTLDDYEEGTWTPTFESDVPGAGRATTVTYARYIKIGNQVFVEFTAQITTLGSGGSGVWVVNGLPFASTNAGCMAIGAANTLATSFTSVGGITNGSRFIMRAQNGSAVSYIQNCTFSTYVTTNTALTATCTYLV
jgi:hypothetical protein